VHASQGRSEQAKPLFDHAVKNLTEAYGPEHPLVAQVIAEQARAHGADPLSGDSAHEYEEALASLEGQFGAGAPETASALDNLGLVLIQQGDYAGAESVLKRAIAARESGGTKDAGELASSIRYLGLTYQERNVFPAAEEQYERAQPLLEAALGAGDSDYGLFLRDMGQVYAAQNKLGQAEDAYGRSLAILEPHLGTSDPMVVETRNSYEQIQRARTTP
jgi:tetratricopeptide (TPR) repeat protein